MKRKEKQKANGQTNIRKKEGERKMKNGRYEIIGQEVIFTSEEAAFLEAIKDPKKRKEIINLLEEAERQQRTQQDPIDGAIL